MQAPPADRGRHDPPQPTLDHDLIVIPEAERHTSTTWWVATSVGVALALVLGIAGGYLFERDRVHDRDAVIAANAEDASAAAAAAIVGKAKLDVAGAQIGELQSRLGTAQQQLTVLRDSRAETRRLLLATRADLDRADAALAKAQREANVLTGPNLPDGRYIGRVVAVGATQAPPRLVLDPGAWFTGAQAHAAAVADGVIGPTERLPHHRYFRNLSNAWRLVRLSPTAIVTMVGWQGRPQTRVIGIERLQEVFASGARWAERARHNLFWVTVNGGAVGSMREQIYP